MGVNPMLDGCMYRGGVVHSGEVHATAEHNRGDTPDYTHEQLRHFHSEYSHHHEVDDALERIRDRSLIAKVSCFCRTMDTVDCLHKEIRERKEALYCSRNDNHKCVRCLERAHALIRVFEEEEIANGLWVITPWVVECCRDVLAEKGVMLRYDSSLMMTDAHDVLFESWTVTRVLVLTQRYVVLVSDS
jgi:hypothetical protein